MHTEREAPGGSSPRVFNPSQTGSLDVADSSTVSNYQPDKLSTNQIAPSRNQLEIFCDATVIGNPGGIGGWGFVALNQDRILFRAHGPLTAVSNNEAEYLAILYALEWLAAQPPEVAIIYSDSQLAIKQINLEYDCNALKLVQLRTQCLDIVRNLDEIPRFVWIRASANSLADLESMNGLAEAMGGNIQQATEARASQERRWGKGRR